ncbi:MAG TPA: response regulator [Xanthobacteraceae bacterium]|jgi:CheY-like chemotaxis protein
MVPAELIGTRGEDPVILVVEDEILIRMSVSEHLRNAGFTVIEAGDADEALRLLRVRPDIMLMLTDIRLPGAMDGSALIRVVRSERPQVKVIAGSGVGTAEPVDGAIKKPYDYEAVIRLIESVLNR